MMADDEDKLSLRASPAVKALVRKGTSPVKGDKGSEYFGGRGRAGEGQKACDIRFEDFSTFRGEVKEVRTLFEEAREGML